MPQRNNPIQPMEPQESSAKKKAIAVVGAGALALAAPFIAKWLGSGEPPTSVARPR